MRKFEFEKTLYLYLLKNKAKMKVKGQEKGMVVMEMKIS
jgi:hypothetical protein